jgi:hypothetical protein
MIEPALGASRLALGPAQNQRFAEDGFLIVPRIIAPEEATGLRERFEPLFAGAFETGMQPDEWNWRPERDPPEMTRQICNAWKSDRVIAGAVLAAEIGEACARLAGWPGARLAQDNLLWKPPRGRPLGFHQDDSYIDWVEPPEMTSCWIALDETSRERGTIEFARGSHRWGLAPPIARFHAPDEPTAELDATAAACGQSVELVPVEVSAGGGAFHHGRVWHGSRHDIAGIGRRALVVHCFSSEARFHARNVGAIYGRYKRVGDTAMDETFFPILWTETGYRSRFIDAYIERGWRGL